MAQYFWILQGGEIHKVTAIPALIVASCEDSQESQIDELPSVLLLLSSRNLGSFLNLMYRVRELDIPFPDCSHNEPVKEDYAIITVKLIMAYATRKCCNWA